MIDWKSVVKGEARRAAHAAKMRELALKRNARVAKSGIDPSRVLQLVVDLNRYRGAKIVRTVGGGKGRTAC